MDELPVLEKKESFSWKAGVEWLYSRAPVPVSPILNILMFPVGLPPNNERQMFGTVMDDMSDYNNRLKSLQSTGAQSFTCNNHCCSLEELAQNNLYYFPIERLSDIGGWDGRGVAIGFIRSTYLGSKFEKNNSADVIDFLAKSGVCCADGVPPDFYLSFALRLETFNGKPDAMGYPRKKKWPEWAAIQNTEFMAKSYAIYTGVDDRVIFMPCRHSLIAFEEGDQFEAEHARYFPTCPVLLARYGDNGVKQLIATADAEKAVRPHSQPKNANEELENQGYSQMEIDEAYMDLYSNYNFDRSNIPLECSIQMAIQIRKTKCAKSQALSQGTQSLASTSSTVTHARGGTTNGLSDDSKNECVVCMDKMREIIFLPCSHLACCKRCVEEIAKDNNQCPICRTPIAQKITFISP